MGNRRGNFLDAQKEVKKRYKMYKAKKNWVYAPILFLGITGGVFISSETVTADELQQSAIEIKEQVQHLPLTKETVSTEIQPLNDMQEQSKQLKQNQKTVTKENNETLDKPVTIKQKLTVSSKKQLDSEIEKHTSDILSNENKVQLEQKQDNGEILSKNVEHKIEENHSRRKRDTLIKVGINGSSTIEVGKQKNSKGEDGTEQNPYSTDADVVLNLNQAKTIDGGVVGNSSKYIVVDIPKTYQDAISFTDGKK